jgi:hypothetical protein
MIKYDLEDAPKQFIIFLIVIGLYAKVFVLYYVYVLFISLIVPYPSNTIP